MSIRIAFFTFNTQAQLYCCLCKKNKNCESKRNFLSFLGPSCITSNFVEPFISQIIKKNKNKLPDIFVISLQESSIKNPKKGFKSDQLIMAFFDCISKLQKKKNKKYSFYSEKMEGIGAEGVRGLRLGLIIDKNLEIKYKFLFFRPLFKSKLPITKGQHFGKGAIMLNLLINKKFKNISNKYILNFINMHLPFLEKEKDQGKSIRDQSIKEIMNYFQSKLELKNNNIQISTFLMGDLNYRINFGSKIDKQKDYINRLETGVFHNDQIKDIIKYDQLYSSIQKNEILENYKEGINNAGPNFFPTCKLIKKCPIEESESRKYQIVKGKTQRVPSWCDRILYNGNNITCLYYDNFDKGYTCKSDHIPVIGLFEINQPKHQ